MPQSKTQREPSPSWLKDFKLEGEDVEESKVETPKKVSPSVQRSKFFDIEI